LVFQLGHQAAITHFGLASAAQYRGAPKMTKITKITKKIKFQMAVAPTVGFLSTSTEAHTSALFLEFTEVFKNVLTFL
jgi:hypothetical protein